MAKATKAKINRVKALWLGIPETWRTEIASAFHTFVPVFMSTFYVFIETSTESVSTSKEALAAAFIAAFLAALRAGFKALSVWLFSRYLPDPKK
jgi:hypothetical protein